MMTHTTYTREDWIIGPVRNDEGQQDLPACEVRCCSCDDESEISTVPGETDAWATRHSTLTGHREYAELTTALLVTSPAPTNPLYYEEQP